MLILLALERKYCFTDPEKDLLSNESLIDLELREHDHDQLCSFKRAFLDYIGDSLLYGAELAALQEV